MLSSFSESNTGRRMACRLALQYGKLVDLASGDAGAAVTRWRGWKERMRVAVVGGGEWRKAGVAVEGGRGKGEGGTWQAEPGRVGGKERGRKILGCSWRSHAR